MYYLFVSNKDIAEFVNVINANPYLIIIILFLLISIGFLVYYNIPKDGDK